jgi:uncharacterized protein YegP (UPF0339 family)
MTKFARTLALITALAVGCMAVSPAPLALAQKDTKKDDKKKDDKKAEKKVGTVEIYKARDGFRFRIKSEEGKTIAMSTSGSDTKEEVVKILDEIKDTMNGAKPMEVK